MTDAVDIPRNGKVSETGQPLVTTDPLELCPLCPHGQPPSPSTQKSTFNSGDDGEAELIWIGCTRCRKWYHSVCVLNGPGGRETIPSDVLEDFEKEDVWWDWAQRLDRWYCPMCLSKASSQSSRAIPKATIKRSLPSPPPSATDATESSTRTNGRPKRKVAENQPDYHALHNHISTPTAKWLALIKEPKKTGRVISERPYTRLPGSILTKQWVESDPSSSPTAQHSPNIFHGPDREPFVVTKEDGGFTSMGGKLPRSGLTVQDVADLVGRDRMVDVIDVATQSSSQWTLAKWADYVLAQSATTANGQEEVQRPTVAKPDLKVPVGKVYNIISLEISGTELARQVKPPRLISEIDWVDNFWPEVKRHKANAADDSVETHSNGPGAKGKTQCVTSPNWPKVQLYCLMGMKGSWTDWHIDFAASSVYYTIHTGSKTFFFIKPTEANLAAYQKWSGDADHQQNVWLGDWCDEVRKVTLHQGDTMIIPAGYIHAVYTPVDSLVFGGNFLHSYSMETEIRLRDIEIATKVPLRFRFPFLDRLCWYVAERYCRDLRAQTSYKAVKADAELTDVPLHPRILAGLAVLADFLVRQLRIMENPTIEDKRRKAIHDKIPGDKIKDPSALARELRWRVKRASGVDSEGEEEIQKQAKDSAYAAKKRKAGRGVSFEMDERQASVVFAATARTRHMVQIPWETTEDEHRHDERRIARPPPSLVSEGSTGAFSRFAVEETDVHQQARQRLRKGDRGLIAEHQTVQVTTTVTVWPASEAAEELYSASATPEVTKETDSTASEALGPITPQPDIVEDVKQEKRMSETKMDVDEDKI